MKKVKNNLNRIELILNSYCLKEISEEQMVNLINKYGIEFNKNEEQKHL